MRARSREINIFSMSALDLFASALGAFILIAVMLFPYFPNTGDSEVRAAEVQAQLEQARSALQAAQAELQASQAQLGACETQRQEVQAALDACEEQLASSASQDALGACGSRNQQLESELETCQVQARKKFLLVIMSWGTRADIDLHVTDPAGREFFYAEREHPGSRAKLEEDNIHGPGNEIWLHPAAEPGAYQVHYKYFNGSGRVRVRGAVLTPEGRRPLPDTALRRAGQKPRIATIEVDSDGNMSVSPR